jgi:regulator of protease activity HflC (stomatin/prohibitin superfamily)
LVVARVSALNWLGQLGDAFLQTLPRRVIICTTEAGVIWHFGRWPRIVKPGWHVVWPLVSELLVIDTRIRSVGLAKLTIRTNDGRTVGASGWLTYQVGDPLKVVTTYEDHEQTLQETAAGAMADVLSETTAETPLRLIAHRLRKRLRRNFAGSGLTIETFALSDYMPCEYPVAIWNTTEGVSCVA